MAILHRNRGPQAEARVTPVMVLSTPAMGNAAALLDRYSREPRH
jgi:hypothetical protein